MYHHLSSMVAGTLYSSSYQATIISVNYIIKTLFRKQSMHVRLEWYKINVAC